MTLIKKKRCAVCQDKNCPHTLNRGTTWLCKKHFYEFKKNLKDFEENCIGGKKHD